MDSCASPSCTKYVIQPSTDLCTGPYLQLFGSKVRDAQLHFRCEHKVTAPSNFPVKTENRHQAENRISSCLKASVPCMYVKRQKVQRLRFPFTQWHQGSTERGRDGN